MADKQMKLVIVTPERTVFDDPTPALRFPTRMSEHLSQIRDGNPKVSPSVVTQSEELERRLKRLGVDLRPRYTLTPPLGDTARHIQNQTKSVSKTTEQKHD